MRALPGGIRVRQAGVADVEAALELVHEGVDSYQEWAPAEWESGGPTPEQLERIRENFGSDAAWVLLAFEGEELVGLVSFAATTLAAQDPLPEGTIYLWQMFVRPAWQGRGLAGALLDRAREEATRRGFNRMVLWAAAGAKQARRFYEREGWTLTGQRDDESNFGLPLVEYEQNL